MLTVCADPNNLPFSNRAGQGFENRLAELIARELHARLDYVWWAQRRGYVRNTLNARKCDLWPGVASNVEMLATTPALLSLDLCLRHPAGRPSRLVSRSTIRGSGACASASRWSATTAATRRLPTRWPGAGIVANVRGFMLYGDYRQPNPPAAIVRAVAAGEVDVGLVWGPLAGYFAARSPVPLQIQPVTPWLDDASWPMVYDISVGVQRGNTRSAEPGRSRPRRPPWRDRRVARPLPCAARQSLSHGSEDPDRRSSPPRRKGRDSA